MEDRFRSQERFSNRVEDYVRSRPSYPSAVLDIASQRFRLPAGAVVADIGSGTGIFTRLLLEQGFSVFGVEPNPQMRAAAEQSLANAPQFHSISGDAENTTLPDCSVDLITVAQAFHWFDAARIRNEWIRILRPPGNVLLVWNDRLTTGSPFLEEYDRFLLSDLTDYRQVGMHTRENIDSVASFFDAGTLFTSTIPTKQVLDYAGFLGRVFSSSYVPCPEDSRHAAVFEQLERIFNCHQKDGVVTLEYVTRVYCGGISKVR